MSEVRRYDPLPIENASGVFVSGTICTPAGKYVKYAAYAALAERLKACEAEKADMVLRNKLLRDRPDLPLERLQAYDQLTADLAAARAEVERLECNHELVELYWQREQTAIAQNARLKATLEALIKMHNSRDGGITYHNLWEKAEAALRDLP